MIVVNPVDPFMNGGSYITSILFGNLINWLLYGALTVQIYLYYTVFQTDRRLIKALVFIVYCLETIQAVGLVVTFTLIIRIALKNSVPPPHSLTTITVFQARLIAVSGGILPFISQCIYANRINITTGMKIIPWIIVVLAVGQLVAALLCFAFKHVTTFVWMAINIVNDTIIAVSMTRTLKKGRLLSRYTRMKVNRLIQLIVGTGTIIVAGNIVILILTLATPNSASALTFMIFLPMLYANSILVMLNNRMTITGPGKFPKCQCANVVFTTLVVASRAEEEEEGDSSGTWSLDRQP